MVASLTNSLSNTLSSTISTAIASALGGALSGQFSGLIDSIKGLFGDGASTTPTPALPAPTPETGTPDITAPTEAIAIKGAVTLATTDITVPAEAVAIKGAVSLALTDITAPTEAVKLAGDINTLTVSAVPPIIYLKGIINATVNPLGPDSIDLSGIPLSLPAAAIKVITPESVDLSEIPVTPPNTIDLSQVPVLLPDATIKPSFDTSGLLPIDLTGLVPGDQNIKASFDTSALLPIDIAGLVPGDQSIKASFDTSELSNLNPNLFVETFIGVKPFFNLTDPPFNLNPNDFVTPLDPITVKINTPETIDLSRASVILPAILSQLLAELKGGEEDEEEGFVDTSTDDGGTTRLQQIINRTPGKGVSAVPAGGEGNSGGFLNALKSFKDSIDSILESTLSALPDDIEGVTRAILGAGVSVGGDGVSFGADAGALTDAQVEALAASLGEDLDSSFKSDFIPTLLGNQPGTVQPGSPDPDDDPQGSPNATPQAPAAPRFTQAAAAGVSAVADVLSLEALANVAQETTLVRVLTSLKGIRLATDRVADQPLVDQLREAGVAVPQTLEDRTNSFLPDVLTQGGLNQFSTFGNLDRQLASMEPTPDLLRVGSEESPGFFNILNLPEIQKVEITNKTLDVNSAVRGIVKTEPQGIVKVEQQGPISVNFGGQTLSVYVVGGQLVADFGDGALENLARRLADSEVGLLAVGAI